MSEAIKRAQKYHDAIRRALLEEWDPIGIRDLAGPDDEYDSYVPEIYKMLISRQPEHQLFQYLWWLETEHMGLSGDRQATESFAKRLIRISSDLDNGKSAKSGSAKSGSE